MEKSRSRHLFSIGHSTHALDDFAALVKRHGVETVVDVRSHPASRFAPEFSREFLARKMPEHGLQYVFLGDRLGGRPRSPDQYDETGRALYFKMADDPYFLQGIELIEDHLGSTTMALMCSEGKPTECHRHLLIERVLSQRSIAVTHILPDGTTTELNVPSHSEPSLFDPLEDPKWKSVRSVLPSETQRAFSKH